MQQWAKLLTRELRHVLVLQRQELHHGLQLQGLPRARRRLEELGHRELVSLVLAALEAEQQALKPKQLAYKEVLLPDPIGSLKLNLLKDDEG